MIFFACTTFFILGMAFGNYLCDGIWVEKAASGFRRECRGKLYTVKLDQ